MDLPRPTLRYESTDIVNLYCYILDEIVQQLQADVPENIKAHSQDIRFLAQRFKDNYLTSNQSIFDKDTFVETINILKKRSTT
jgi:RimJ/RimL family protein N-acetyltransferase